MQETAHKETVEVFGVRFLNECGGLRTVDWRHNLCDVSIKWLMKRCDTTGADPEEECLPTWRAVLRF
jgi:hypothetical protein